ncbi:TetR/AcrR family transcriptional regulator C-terminal domain-containing protein [Nocardia vinacea]|uniref:TetR/AcrR family transcriptional regulator C-terminal domain-containing protein n=1 Tax=Nocardia vinacea TaxID=96468 RepID=UPI002E15E290|nr:TetR/AcrR family transcriptional regulator C-terminal domain-containing protein [Nocardia vinacea]
MTHRIPIGHGLGIARLAAEVDYPPLTGDVQRDIIGILEQLRALYRCHPRAPEVESPTLCPHTMRYLDHMAGALAPTGLDATATLTVIGLLTGWVRALAAQEEAGLSARANMADHISAMLSHGDYPQLTALFATLESATPPDTETAFRTCIEALLFGIIPLEP